MLNDCSLLLESIPDAIFMLNRDGYITFTNPAASSMTGYIASELLNQHIAFLYKPDYDYTKAEYELGLAQKNEKFSAEGWKFRKDKTKFWGEHILSCLYDEQKAPIGYCCTLRDRSEKKTG
ncbi:PAS domain-containing protein [Spirosoma taeanense]|uniref:PAS domain-containing protein n=1 Tax=Spirosoma taeanense TaxID=2735870 RepID=A0A6M5YCB6_9BACT|nr:PAS domain-containing protein [Spirosoma taeanense]QJW90930.1 PAS domain-containing protein [Spirosoma taeanense]